MDQYLIQLLHRVEQAGRYRHLPDGSRPREEEVREEMGLRELHELGHIRADITDTFNGTIIRAKLSPAGYRFLREQSGQAIVRNVQRSPGHDFSGRGKILFSQRLGDDWRSLADLFEIPLHERHKFAQGEEARGIWEWLQLRNYLGNLPGALREIGRADISDDLTIQGNESG